MSMLINLLSNSGYIIVNKIIIKKIGLHEAIILGELCSEYSYWNKENKLENGFFYSTRENIEENTGLSPYQQRVPFKNLIEKGIIFTKEMGMPLKIWYSINDEMIYKLLLKTDLISSSEETSHQDIKKLEDKQLSNCIASSEKTTTHDIKELDINNNNINNNNNNILSNLINKTPDNINEIDEIDYAELFKTNIEYSILIEDKKISELLHNITDVVIETLNSRKEVININSEPKNIEIVRSQLLKLKAKHILYVISCLEKNMKDVKSIKSYILTALYNSVNTFQIDVTLQVAKMINN